MLIKSRDMNELEFKGTKGKWEAVNILGYPRVGEHPYIKCGKGMIIEMPKGGDCDKIESNAKLIAAAPELLEALQELLSVDEIDAHALFNVHQKANKAINKALK